MTTTQASIVIRESIRQAAQECGCKPSEAYQPPVGNHVAKAARDIAIRLAYDQGLSRPVLAEAFGRTVRTISDALRMSRAE